MTGKNVLKFLLVLAIAAVMMLAIRTYAFTIYTVNDSSLKPELEEHNRVLVNKLSRNNFVKGDLLVFHSDADYIGKVTSLPGDTIVIGRDRYILPNTCGCKDCQCVEHNCYVVDMGKKKHVVTYHDIIGKAYRLFPLTH